MNRMGIAVLFAVNFLCVLTSLAFAITWANVYDAPIVGMGATSIQPTSDGGYIVAGSMWNGSNNDVWIIKLTSTGSVSWQKRYGGASQESDAAVLPTSDGGYILGAITNSYGAGDYDGWVVKLTSTGAIQWQTTYGGTSYDGIYTIQQTADGGFILAGYTGSFGDEVHGDAWVAKINSSGATVWQKALGSSNTYEVIFDIQEISGGRFICAGRREDEAWVLMLTPLGKIKWQKSYGGSGTDEAYGVQRTSDGGFVVAGQTDSFGASGFDFWVFKLNSSGSILWQKTYGGAGADALRGMDYTSDGGTIVSGWMDLFAAPNAWAIKLDSSGEITWQKTYGGGNSDGAPAIQQTSDGDYILAGQTSSFGATPSNAWVLKLDSNGNIGFSCSIINSSSAAAVNSNAVTTILPATSVSIPVKSNTTSAVPVNFSTTIIPLC